MPSLKKTTQIIENLAKELSKSDDKPDNAGVKLKVLKDEAAQKLAKKVWAEYIEPKDYTHFSQFLVDFDQLLAKARLREGHQPSNQNHQTQDQPAAVRNDVKDPSRKLEASISKVSNNSIFDD